MSATLAGVDIDRLTVHLPAHGIWFADAELAEAAELSGAVTLFVAGLELTGAIVAGGVWEGRARYRVAGGAGRWGQEIAARSYANEAGVKLAKVIGDAAADCGETFDGSTASGTVGPQWTRERGPASRALALLAPQAWYVGEDGVTRLGAREPSTYEAEAARLDYDEAAGKLELGPDTLAGLIPGVVIDGVEAVDVAHTLLDGAIRTTIYGASGSTTTRLAGAVVRLVEAITARTKYHGLWSYRVVAQSGERLDLQCGRASSGLPNLQQVRVRPGIAGARADWTMGSMVLVAFVDGSPSRPVVLGADEAGSGGFVPDALDLCDALGCCIRDGELVDVPGLGTVILTVNAATFGGQKSKVSA